MFDDFLVRAVLAGLVLAMVAGPLGAFVVWQRMAFFGDTMAHGALLGVALAAVFSLAPHLAIFAVSVLVATAFYFLGRQTRLGSDALLGILAHGTLAAGLLVIFLLDLPEIDLLAILFGDILAISVRDLYWIMGGSGVLLLLLAVFWQPLLAVAVNEELARAEGLASGRYQLLLTLLLALFVTAALQVAGVLLITALLVIPAATARRFAATPAAMALIASCFGWLSVGGGFGAAYGWDLPAGPAIVVTALGLFIVTRLLVPAAAGDKKV